MPQPSASSNALQRNVQPRLCENCRPGAGVLLSHAVWLQKTGRGAIWAQRRPERHTGVAHEDLENEGVRTAQGIRDGIGNVFSIGYASYC